MESHEISFNANLGSDALDDMANEASDNILRSGRSRLEKGLEALHGAAIAATGDPGSSEGSSDEESDFGEHFDMESLDLKGLNEDGRRNFSTEELEMDVAHFIWLEDVPRGNGNNGYVSE